MLAKCFRSVQCHHLISDFVPDRSIAKVFRLCRFYGISGQNGKPGTPLTLKYAAQKLNWPRHPHHRPPPPYFWHYPVAVTTPEEAREVVVRLDDNGRALVLEQLKKFEEEKAINAGVAADVPPTVTTAQLVDVFMFNSLPFVGFGILDNGVMIVAGEYIDLTIGTALGISTMAAAALGNLVSDVAGVGSAGYIETLVTKIGIKTPDITPAQSELRAVRWIVGLGRAIGISVGCLIGMLPLLFYHKKDDKESESKTDAANPATPSTASG